MEGDNEPIYEQRFNAAVKVIQNLPSNGEYVNDTSTVWYCSNKNSARDPSPTFIRLKIKNVWECIKSAHCFDFVQYLNTTSMPMKHLEMCR